MTAFLSALALAVALEGIAYAAFPEQMKKALATLLATPSGTIRFIGLATAAVGLVALWLVRSFG